MRKGRVNARPFHILKIGIAMPRVMLYERINRRVEAMVEGGLEEEARRMLPYRDHNALQTVGYTEWFANFDGRLSRQETIDRSKRNSRRYAKRQLTWFRRDPAIYWLPEADASTAEDYIRAQIQLNR